MKLVSYVTIAVLFALILALLAPTAMSAVAPSTTQGGKCPCPPGTPPGRTCPCPSATGEGTCPCPVCPCPGDGVTYDETKLR